jgi:hypothetical protein
MTFSDGDLKRLKEETKRNGFAGFDCAFMQALLARLEAAETIIWLTPSNLTNCKEGSILDDAINAWRTAAGRSGK